MPWCKTTFKAQNRSKLVDNVREIVIENYEEDKILRNRKESEQVDLKKLWKKKKDPEEEKCRVRKML
jgi:hypothetical protein